MRYLLSRTRWVLKGNRLNRFVQSMFLMCALLFIIGMGYSVRVHADTPAAELIVKEDMGTLDVGYSKAEANELRQEIKVRNNGEETIYINKGDVTYYINAQAFRLESFEEDQMEIGPGEERVVGTIRPAHGMNQGKYTTQLEIYLSDVNGKYLNSMQKYTGYRVRSTGIGMRVTRKGNENGFAANNFVFDEMIAGKVTKSGEIRISVINEGQKDFILDITSDKALFKADYSKNPVKAGEIAEVKLYTDVAVANTLKAGEYTGNITFCAAAVDEDVSVESKERVSIKLNDLQPRWETQEKHDERNTNVYSIGYVPLRLTNIDGIDNINDYLMAELVEGKETYSIPEGFTSYGSLRLIEKANLPAGDYKARVRLWFDETGKGNFSKAENLGDFVYTLRLVDGSKYQIDITKDYEEDYLFLGYLNEGYTQEEADALMKNIVAENIGSEALNVSPSGLIYYQGLISDTDQEAFVLSDSKESTILNSGESYDKAWIKPATGLAAGVYYAYLVFMDDDNKICPFYYKEVCLKVQKPGFGYDITSGKNGLDYGYATVNAAGSSKEKRIYFSNTGGESIKLTADLTNNAGGVFSFSDYPDTESISQTIKAGKGLSIYVKCNTQSIVQTPGKTQGMITLTAVNEADENDKETIEIPLNVEVVESLNVNVTLDFQGKGGGEYQNTTMSFKRGTAFNKVLNSLIAKATGQKESAATIGLPTDEEYTVIAFTKKKDQDLESWEDVKTAEQEVKDGVLKEDTTIYVNWARNIDSARLTVEAPKDGEKTGPPVVAVAEGEHFQVSADDEYTYWKTDAGEEIFTGEKNYQLRTRLLPEFGYAFSSSCTVKINNKKANIISSKDSSADTLDAEAYIKSGNHSYGAYQQVDDKVHQKTCTNCDHVIKEEHQFNEGEVTKTPGDNEPGEKTYTCTLCGYEKHEEIPPTGHEEAGTSSIVFYKDMAGKTIGRKIDVKANSSLAAYADTVPEEIPEDHSFAGWTREPRADGGYSYKETVGDESILFAFDGNMPAETLNLYPVFIKDRLRVDLDLGDGGSESAPASFGTRLDGKEQSDVFYAEINEKLQMDALNTASRPGYELVGWFTRGGVKCTDDWAITPKYCELNDKGEPVIGRRNNYDYYILKLTAKWKPVSVAVKYNVSGQETVSEEGAAAGTKLILANAPEAAEDMVFDCWTDKNGGRYAAGEEILLDDDRLKELTDDAGIISFTAMFMSKINPEAPAQNFITFDTAGGSYVPAISADAGTPIEVPEDPVRDGFRFEGWIINGEAGFPEVMPETNTVVTAKWTAVESRIHFETNGGSVLADIAGQTGADIRNSKPADPVREHYIFTGWMPAYPDVMPEKELILYALWTPQEYVLTYDANGGTFPDGTATLVQKGIYDSLVFVAGDPVRKGYTFSGWSEPAYSHMPGENKTLKAVWTKSDEPSEGGDKPSGGNDKPSGGSNTPAGSTEKPGNTAKTDDVVKAGSLFKIAGNSYKVISTKKKTVSLTKASKSKKTFVLPASVKIKGKKYKVTSIGKKAFKGTKVKTLTVKTKKLTKKSVKGSLKGSKVKTVKVKAGKKKVNKKYVKKYKKIFTKKNAGKKVTVK